MSKWCMFYGKKINAARGRDVISLLLEPLETKGMMSYNQEGILMLRTSRCTGLMRLVGPDALPADNNRDAVRLGRSIGDGV